MRAQKLLASVVLRVAIGIAGPLALAAGIAPGAQAAGHAAWKLTLNPMPTNFAPGSSSEYLLVATNVGTQVTTSEPLTIKATLPQGLKATEVSALNNDPSASTKPQCTPEDEGQSATCTTTEPIHPGRLVSATIKVEVTATQGTREASASAEGGGAAQKVSTSTITPIGAVAVPFGFLPGFSAPSIDKEGFAAAAGGTHPHQLTINANFPTQKLGDQLAGAGHFRDIVVNLPRGLLGDPAAAPVLCTEAELTSEGTPDCPEESQVGVINLTTGVGPVGTVGVEDDNLYAMVPPPGSPAEFGFNAIGIGVFVHLIAGIRTDGDYGAYSTTNDVIALGSHPVFNFQAQLWGNPTGEEHDLIRGECENTGERLDPPGPCSVIRRETAFLTMPSDCPGNPIAFSAFADSWEEPGIQREASYENADLKGAAAPIEGCGALQFTPTIEAQPTTNRTESPSGLEVDLHQPQETNYIGTATANLKDATIAFPAGMTVNPAQGAGLGACTEQQIGFAPSKGQIHFTKAPQGCPDSSKVGTAEVITPLLAQRDEEHHTLYDGKGNPVPEPLHGSLYLAKPFVNPFGSLLAVYLAIEDPRNGIVAKLAGKAELDPTTGQLSTRFEENPELPVEDFKAHLFGGARGAFITPPTCATYTTTTDLTPWSAPEGKDEHPSDSFQTAATPDGSPCPGAESQLPNKPAFSAGMVSPAAGKYSPFVMKLSRADGSQRLAGFEMTLPGGLSARLAGLGQCSDAQIAKARARSNPNEGALEQANPSCPAAAEIGVLNAGAGAGPTPLYVQGHAYLAGPYKGAPLSIVTVTPAVAGPFDLGVVVVRAALGLDPASAQAHIVSDPFPQILDGIPLDLRSVAVRADRPNFTLNPTSCDEKTIVASATSTLGQVAPLQQRFQVGGCKALSYKPSLHARLFGATNRGAHPRLRGVFQAKPGEAGTARIAAALPHSEFIDQAHFRTICTRVQFAAKQCPAGSIYGHVKVITPLLDYPLEGPVYLRSSTHELPDVVAAVHGPPSQPIEIESAGRVDSVNGGLRIRFQSVPDAPISKIVFTAQGAKKGLFQNSTDICRGANRIDLKLDGQNGKTHDAKPLLKADCQKKGKKKRH
jgi:hypothetical protein